MSKTNKRKPRPRRPSSGPDHFEGETAEDLMRALEIDHLTIESCFEALFGDDLDDLVRGPHIEDVEEPVYRVTQAGPPRRDPPKAESES